MRRFFYFTVFVSGMTTLAAEFSASRLLGNVFGTSNIVWASIIGLILVYLTVGYMLGGRWADRSPYPKTMYAIVAWGAFTLGIVPFVATPVLRAAATAFDVLSLGIVAGSFTAVLVLFSIPVTLLGMVSPFAIRISMEDASRAGNVAGTINAISTLGSFIGTFLPTLVLIPTIGTTRTILFFSVLLLVVALIGLAMSAGKRAMLSYLIMPFALAIIAWLGWGGPLKASQGQIYETESAYNYIQVLQSGEYHYLRLNDGQGIHSMYHPVELFYGGPWEQFLVGPFFNTPPYSPSQVKRIAIVGLAAGTTARQATAVFGDIPIDGYEIDPKIVEIGQEYFGMIMPNLTVHVEDGRWGLEHSPFKYDIIAVDAYRPPYIPPHLTTQEFFSMAANHLSENGVLAINVGRSPNDRRLIEDLVATIHTVLPSIYVMDIPGTFNSMIYATHQPTDANNLTSNLVHMAYDPKVHPLLTQIMQVTYLNIQPTPVNGIVFTDDLAPIEWITNDMILSYLASGGVDEIK